MGAVFRESDVAAQDGISCDMVVFGGTGDLAMRKLLPALYYLHRDGHLHEGTRIYALARAQQRGQAASIFRKPPAAQCHWWRSVYRDLFMNDNEEPPEASRVKGRRQRSAS